MLAYFEELSPASDRRRSVRRALKLGATSGDQAVTIHDLSLTGALLETSIPMLVGSTFEFELPEAGKVEAVVVWNGGEYYGCQFELPISPRALSAALLKSTPERSTDQAGPDPLAELRDLNEEVERLAFRMDNALRRLTRK
ncbi:MAG TPA: PilZ domain-containing protein [Sphingomicrobium sp.]|nr:PilZ domain-containing protein [Sphingomicrobium sp.]